MDAIDGPLLRSPTTVVLVPPVSDTHPMTFDGVGRVFGDDLHALGLRLRRLTNVLALTLDIVAERLDPSAAANLRAQRLAAEARRFVGALDDLLLGAAPPGDVNPL